jgi:hypothetical protein
MAEALFLVRRTSQGVNDDRNRVREVLVNNDDGDADAVIMQNVVDLLNVAHPAGGEAVYPVGYFDTVEVVAVSSGPLSTDGDFIAYSPRVAAVVT